MSDALVERLAGVLAGHQRIASKPGGPCWCGQWPSDAEPRVTWMQHVAEKQAEVVEQEIAAARAESLREAAEEGREFLGDETDSAMAWQYVRDIAARIARTAAQTPAASPEEGR